MSTADPTLIDARRATRARQPGHPGLREVVVTITQSATGRRQAVCVAAADERGARALAMMHCTILDGVPRDLDPASLALRHLEFEVRPDGGDSLVAPNPVPPARVAPEPAAPPAAAGGAFPGDYSAYSLVIAVHPHYWTPVNRAEPTVLEARRQAAALADTAREIFPGVRCDLVPGAVEKLDLSSGPDVAARERLETWVERRMGEMLAR